MYAMSAQETDEHGADGTDYVSGVLESAGHCQNSCAQAGLEEMYPSVEKPTGGGKKTKQNRPDDIL